MSSPISGFTAIPNPYMVPLLYYQSLLIGAGFGIGYQGMRRKLSAMSNDDFNKLDLGIYAFEQFKEITAKSHFDKALNMMHPIMDKLAAAFGQMINKLPDNFLSFFRGVTEGPSTTDTSATNIDYRTGTFEIQGGSRQGDFKPKENPSSSIFRNSEGQTYDEWIAFNKVDETVAKLKAESSLNFNKIKRDIERSKKAAGKIRDKQVLDRSIRPGGKKTGQFKTPAQHKATAKENKRKLQVNLISQLARAKLKKLEYDRMIKFMKSKNPRTTSNAYIAKLKRSASILRNSYTDALQKANNIKRLLRNYR